MARRTSVHPEENLSSNGRPANYHITPNGERWDILRNGVFIGTIPHNMGAAIEHAITAAQRDHQVGIDADVCIEELSGHCRHVWP